MRPGDPVVNGTARGEVRRRLSALGNRRKKREAAGEKLAEEIKEALEAVRLVGGITMDEAADRLGLNRTTLYQVYLDDEQPARPAVSA